MDREKRFSETRDPAEERVNPRTVEDARKCFALSFSALLAQGRTEKLFVIFFPFHL